MREWQRPMDAEFWPRAAKKVVRNWPFLTKRPSNTNKPGYSPQQGLTLAQMGTFTFGKDQHLTRKKIIELLFQKGNSKSHFPLRVIYLPHPDPNCKQHQVLISVPARTIRKAVSRNTIKRRIREGYRLNKSLLQSNPPICVAYIYMAREVMPTPPIHEAVRSSLQWIQSRWKGNWR